MPAKTVAKPAAAAAKPAAAAAPAKGAKPAAAPAKPMTVAEWKAKHSHLFVKKPKKFGIGQTMAKRDLTRFVKWPTYVRIQRQRAILKSRIKVPAALNQFNVTFNKDQATALFQLLGNYRPEDAKQKAARRKAAAAVQAKNAPLDPATKPKFIKYGLNHITDLIESKKAKLVVIAHDVDPVELVVWLPTLCRKMDVPFCIVKGKSRLGYLVHKKTASALAITDVNKEHLPKLQQLVDSAKLMFGEPFRAVGGLKLSTKALATIVKKKKAQANAIKA